jgi:hypothetical protein
VRVARYIHSGVQDWKDLPDAHFARALAHVLAVLRQLRSNRTEKIATAAGLAGALMKPVMSNHVVQLVEMDLPQLDAINTYVSGAVKALQPFFANCVDIIYNNLATPMLTWAELQAKMATAAGVTLNVTAFAYSGIDGSTFDITFSSAGPRVVRAAAAAVPAAADEGEDEGEGEGQDENEDDDEDESEDDDGHEGAEVDGASAVQFLAEQLQEQQAADDQELDNEDDDDDHDDNDDADGNGSEDDDDDNNDDDDDDDEGGGRRGGWVGSSSSSSSSSTSSSSLFQLGGCCRCGRGCWQGRRRRQGACCHWRNDPEGAQLQGACWAARVGGTNGTCFSAGGQRSAEAA